MPIQSSALLTSDYTQDDIEAAPDAVRSATVEQAKSDLLTPSILRATELSAARNYGVHAKKYAPDAAKQYMADAGLDGHFTFDRDYNELELGILANRKRAELKRQAILARANQSGTATAGRFGLTLATSFLDPLTVATAFVPVIGEAKYAQLLGKAGGALGRAGVRASVGAAEGAAGSLLMEPIVAGAKLQEQADYTLADSLLNIGVGGVMGGGLHVAGGAVRDAIRPAQHAAEAVPLRIDEPAQESAAIEPLPDDFDPFAKPALPDRLANDLQLREALANMRNEAGWAEVGGRMVRKTEDADSPDYAVITGRTQWIPRADWWPVRPAGMNEADVKAAVDVALAGGKLTKRQTNMVEFMTGVADERTKTAAYLPTDQELALEGLAGIDSAYEAGMVARASELDDAAVERLATQYGDDDAGFLMAVKRWLDENEIRNTSQSSATSESAPSNSARGAVTGSNPDVREAALRSAVSQAVTGQPIEARPIYDRATLKEAAGRLSDPDQRPLSDPDAVKRANDTIAAGETADDTAIDKQVQELDEQLASLEADAALAGQEDFAEIIAAVMDEFKESGRVMRESSGHAQMLAACALRSAA